MESFKEYLLGKKIKPGRITQVAGPIVHAENLPNVSVDELVIFDNDEIGQVLSLKEDFTEILTFSNDPVNAGSEVIATGRILEIPTGTALLGQTINPFGRSLSGDQKVNKDIKKSHIGSDTVGIDGRKTITKPLETGVSMVDLMVPLGRGQRELVIGDRKTGKTQFVLQAAMSAIEQGNICIYAAIGKKNYDIKRIESFFEKAQIKDKVIIVATSSDTPPGAIYITPYSAMTIAEHFRDHGQNVLVILDDLSTHAKFYREISLLGKRFPGRNSYPGDMFYIHAKLLERAGNFKTEKGETAITCLPIAETIEGDLSGYIQTNIMSMTDGHIYFDSNLFAKGRRPAINPFLSVTRVGKQTQSDTRRALNRELFSFLTLYEKTQNVSHFGAEMSDASKVVIATGGNIEKLLDQKAGTILPPNVQLILFSLIWEHYVEPENDSFEPLKEKVLKQYLEDKSYAKLVDDMVSSSTSFNDLISKVTENRTKLLEGGKHEDKK